VPTFSLRDLHPVIAELFSLRAILEVIMDISIHWITQMDRSEEQRDNATDPIYAILDPRSNVNDCRNDI
jgi:hypothetical protein